MRKTIEIAVCDICESRDVVATCICGRDICGVHTIIWTITRRYYAEYHNNAGTTVADLHLCPNHKMIGGQIVDAEVKEEEAKEGYLGTQAR